MAFWGANLILPSYGQQQVALRQIGGAAAQAPAPQATPALPAAGQRVRTSWRDGALQIDGKINEAAWNGAELVKGFWQPERQRAMDPADDTQVRLLRDDNYLYIAIQAFDPLATAIGADQRQPDGPFELDDALTLELDPSLTGSRVLRFGVNAIGTTSLAADGLEELAQKRSWQAAAQRHSWGWSAEIAIPLTLLGIDPAQQLSRLGFNVVRYHRRRGELSEWVRRSPKRLARDLGQLLSERPAAAEAQTVSRSRNSSRPRWRVSPVGLRGASALTPLTQSGLILTSDREGQSTSVGLQSTGSNGQQISYRDRFQLSEVHGLQMQVQQRSEGMQQAQEISLAFDGSHDSGLSYSFDAAVSNRNSNAGGNFTGSLSLDRGGWSVGADINHTQAGYQAITNGVSATGFDPTATETNAWIDYLHQPSDGWLREISAGVSGNYGLASDAIKQSVDGYLSVELRQAQLRLRLDGSMARTQWQNATNPLDDCADTADADDPEAADVCFLELDNPTAASDNVLKLSLDGGTRNPWLSYGISHTQASDLEGPWSLTEFKIRLKTSSALSWNLGTGYNSQTQDFLPNLTARWVIDPRSSLSVGAVGSTSQGMALQAGYSWRVADQLEMSAALQANQQGALGAGLRLWLRF